MKGLFSSRLCYYLYFIASTSWSNTLFAQPIEPSVIAIYRSHIGGLDKHYLYLNIQGIGADSVPPGCVLYYSIHDEGATRVTGRVRSYPDWPGDKIDITSVAYDTTYVKAILSRDAFGNVRLKFAAVASTDALQDIAAEGTGCIIEKSDEGDWGRAEAKKSGTGFLISDRGLLVTNYHLVDRAGKITVKCREWSTEATVLARDMDNDLVVLKLPDSIARKAEVIPFGIRNVQADLGERISVFGYPLTTSMGKDVKLTTGIVSSVNGYQGNANSYQLTAPVQPGNSGGPVFDEKANLIGVINAKHLLAENATYAIKSTYLLDFLQTVPEYNAMPANSELAQQHLVEQAKALQKLVYLIEIR